MMDAAGVLKLVSVGAVMDRCEGGDDVGGPPVSGNCTGLGNCTDLNTAAGSVTRTGLGACASSGAGAGLVGGDDGGTGGGDDGGGDDGSEGGLEEVMDVEVVVVSVGQFSMWASSSEGVVLVVSTAVEVWTRAIGAPEIAGKNEETASMRYWGCSPCGRW